MTNTIDTRLMKMADNHSKVSGTYFGICFSGVAISSRLHSITYREQVTIKLNKAIEKPGKNMDGSQYKDNGSIIISATDIENKLHTIREVK